LAVFDQPFDLELAFCPTFYTVISNQLFGVHLSCYILITHC